VRQHFSYEGEHQERVVAGVRDLSTREWVNMRRSEDHGIQTEVDEEVDEEVELEASMWSHRSYTRRISSPSEIISFMRCGSWRSASLASLGGF
jgi:hypothetical protein